MITQCNEKMTCDAKGCKNFASAYFEVKGLLKKLYLCKECQKKLFDDLAKTNMSKSPKNKISSKRDEKQGVTSGR